MKLKLKLYSVSEEYINYLRKYDSRVYDNKINNRNHKRKYLGVVLKINSYNYFIPLSSPKETDYLNGNIRSDSPSIIRMHNNKDLFGTLRLSNMIPVPNTEIEYYDIQKEKDEFYKFIVLNELRFINKNKKIIVYYSNSLYNQKNNNVDKEFLKNTVDFNLLETKCDEWINKKKKSV